MQDALIFGTVGLITGMILFVIAGLQIARVFDSGKWETTDGTIVSSRLETMETADGSEEVAYIEYEYIVRQRAYYSTRVGLLSQPYGTPRQIVRRYAKNRAVRVFYNPQNPAEACLIRQRASLMPWALLVLALVFIPASLLLLIYRPNL